MSEISFVRRFQYLENENPDKIAILFEDITLSRKELNQRSNQMARLYIEKGANFGDTITICLPKGIGFFIACLAAWKIGATPNPLAANMPKVELELLIAEAASKLVVGLEDLAADIPGLVTDSIFDGRYSNDPLPDCIAPYERALASGGSTGRPKLIILNKQPVYETDNAHWFFKPKKAVLVVAAHYHALGFGAAWQGLLAGALVVLINRFEPELCLQLIEKHGIDRIHFVPTMMHRISRLPEEVRNRYDLSSLDMVLVGTAPCPQWLMREWIEWLGPDRIYEGYGPSERIGNTLISGKEWLEHPGSVGKPINGCQIRILDDKQKQLPTGEIGNIFMLPAGGPGSTYHYQGAESQRLADGWETVGDMGHLDADGYLYISDRRVDMIISGGRNIFPAEVEAAIDRHPLVESSAVIGLPDSDMGQRVHAIVHCEQTIDSQELLDFMETQLVRYKLPRTIEFVDKSLRSEIGKLRRSALRDERNRPEFGLIEEPSK